MTHTPITFRPSTIVKVAFMLSCLLAACWLAMQILVPELREVNPSVDRPMGLLALGTGLVTFWQAIAS